VAGTVPPRGDPTPAACDTQMEKLKFLGDHAAISNSIRLAGQIRVLTRAAARESLPLAGAGAGGAGLRREGSDSAEEANAAGVAERH
jgi:hypothetical protein